MIDNGQEKKKLFIRFLKERNSFYDFFNERGKQRGENGKIPTDFGAETIMCSFMWTKTRLGHGFWSDLQKEWVKIYYRFFPNKIH